MRKALRTGAAMRRAVTRVSAQGLVFLVVAYGDRISMVMVFFGDLAHDLVGKPDDLLVVDHYGLILTVPKGLEILEVKRRLPLLLLSGACTFHLQLFWKLKLRNHQLTPTPSRLTTWLTLIQKRIWEMLLRRAKAPLRCHSLWTMLESP